MVFLRPLAQRIKLDEFLAWNRLPAVLKFGVRFLFAYWSGDPSLSERSSAPAGLPTDLEWMQLSLIPGLGPRLRQALLDQFGTPAEILKASPTKLQLVSGIGTTLATAISKSRNRLSAQDELSKCRANDFNIVTTQNGCYPVLLKQIADPPGLLYVHGTLAPSDAVALAIVGTRHASRYGLEQAERFATGLTQAGFTIVSGLARGIDTAAHTAAIGANGRTLAVLGSGLLELYPPENKQLARLIANHGAVLSENRLEQRPKPSSFPQRNRIVTGLALGVIVIEAAKRSGALISAKHALEQNREVFVVPGRVDRSTSSGCHQLIREGAVLVENVDQVIEELGPLAETTNDLHGQMIQCPRELQLNPQERQVLDAIDQERVSIETLVTVTQLPVSRVLSTINVLEMKRLVTRFSGSRFSRRQLFDS